MPITELLKQNAGLYGDDVCLVEVNPEYKTEKQFVWKGYDLVETPQSPHFRREITWRVFYEKANRFANLLIQRGIGRENKVAILLMNCLEWLPVYFGVLNAGAIAVPMNFRFTTEEIDYGLRLAEADVLIFGDEFIERVTKLAESTDKRWNFIYMGEGACPEFAENYYVITSFCPCGPPAGVEITDDDYAAIYFSSGTTGFPKAILHKHRSLTHACLTEQNHHGQTRGDVFLCIPPLYHTGAKMHWFGSLLTGGKAVLLKGAKPEHIIETVASERCTIVWLLVPWAIDILNAIENGKIVLSDYGGALDQWRLMHIGAQPVPQSLVRNWLAQFPRHQYDTNYGLAESIGPGCVHLGIGNTHKVGAIGLPGYGWEVKIVDVEGAPVADGEVGELCVRGAGVMECYFNDERATRESLRGGWLHSGDMAVRDEDGFISLVDRKKDVIISGGENIYPVQIENFLSSCPIVSDAAVIGLPDRRLGEIPLAIIELKPGREYGEDEARAEIQKHCLGLPRYIRPKKIEFMKIPRNPTGKIEKPLLRKIFGAADYIAAQNKN